MLMVFLAVKLLSPFVVPALIAAFSAPDDCVPRFYWLSSAASRPLHQKPSLL
jgi:hypothetical protein